MELQEVVDEEGRLESTHSLVRLLCGLAAHGASDKVLASLDLHGKVGKAVVTERVETGQCPGLSVVIQTDWTGQLLLEILKSLNSCGCFLHGLSSKCCQEASVLEACMTLPSLGFVVIIFGPELWAKSTIDVVQRKHVWRSSCKMGVSISWTGLLI